MQPKKKGQNRIVGRIGENIASAFLKKNGYRIINRNVRTPFGEIDIIALKKGHIIFVEVKTRTSNDLGPPFLAVTKAKQKKLKQNAYAYLHEHGTDPAYAQIDIISINLTDSLRMLKLEHMKNTIWDNPF